MVCDGVCGAITGKIELVALHIYIFDFNNFNFR
jgi:hypothetical protein